MSNFNQKDYTQEIIEMVKKIKNTEYLRKIYNYIVVPYELEQKKEEK